MTTLEQDLRGRLAERGDVDRARTDLVRGAALGALTSGRRRARVRRVLSVAASAAVVAGMGGFLLLALPRGARDPLPAAPRPSTPFPTISALDRDATPADRLVDPGDADGTVALSSARRVAATSRFRFYAARGDGPLAACLLAVRPMPPSPGVPGGGPRQATQDADCVAGDTLANYGVLAARAEWVREAHVGLLVPDGITAVRLGRLTTSVRGNAAVFVVRGTVPNRVTLIGPSAPRVRLPSGTDRWAYGRTRRGLPWVTVDLLAGDAPRVPTAVTVPDSVGPDAVAGTSPVPVPDSVGPDPVTNPAATPVTEAPPSAAGVDPVAPAPAPQTAPEPTPVGRRGTWIARVVATPSLRRLTVAGAGIPASNELTWVVSVQNTGTSVERDVRVVAVLRVPGAPPVLRRGRIARLDAGRTAVARLRGPSQDEAVLGERGRLEVRVARFDGSRYVLDDRVAFPVTITFG